MKAQAIIEVLKLYVLRHKIMFLVGNESSTYSCPDEASPIAKQVSTIYEGTKTIGIVLALQ